MAASATPLRDRITQIRARFTSTAKQAPERLAPPMEVALLDEIAGRIDDLSTQFGTMTNSMNTLATTMTTMASTIETMSTTLKNLQNRADEQVPKGLQDQEDVAVTDQLTYYDPPEPLFSVDIKNDGAASVHYALNDATLDFVEIKKNEGRTVSYGRGIIKRIYFKCDQGQTATIRVTGTF